MYYNSYQNSKIFQTYAMSKKQSLNSNTTILAKSVHDNITTYEKYLHSNNLTLIYQYRSISQKSRLMQKLVKITLCELQLNAMKHYEFKISYLCN
jgi:hypothetical protein